VSDPRVLIFGPTYCANQHARYLANLSGKLLRQLNPGCDLMLIDSASPLSPDWGQFYFSFPDNIGHLNHGGQDGWGRAFCKGLEYAVEHDYDYAVCVEADVLLAKPILPIIERMEAASVMCAAPWVSQYNFIEVGLFFAHTRWLASTRLAERYDWRSSVIEDMPERKVERLAGDDLWVLPMRGARNDQEVLTPQNIKAMSPYGLDWITHADFATIRAFLAMNGLSE